MHDTPEHIERKICEMIQKKSPLERLRMGCSMYDTSRILVIRAIKENNPNITTTELRKELFLKFYGNDFDIITRNSILKYLE